MVDELMQRIIKKVTVVITTNAGDIEEMKDMAKKIAEDFAGSPVEIQFFVK